MPKNIKIKKKIIIHNEFLVGDTDMQKKKKKNMEYRINFLTLVFTGITSVHKREASCSQHRKSGLERLQRGWNAWVVSSKMDMRGRWGWERHSRYKEKSVENIDV